MDIVIRNETEKDFHAVEHLTREAFWNLYAPGCVEHYLAHRLRQHPDFIPELDFVAEYNCGKEHRGAIVGSILYARAWLTAENGQEMPIAGFGPISVLPECQRKGVGSALIRHTTALARDMGIQAIVILGDPHNYCKHGFKSAKDLHISNLNGEYPYGMLALELQAGALAGHEWKFRYSAAYDIDEKEAEEYDRRFEKKEKGYQYSQEVFSIAVRAYVK